MWFIYSLITTLAWGAADLFYKKGADESEKYSHLKTSVTVGLVMGAHAIVTLIAGDMSYNPKNLLIYLPVSMMYILSMTVGYFGLRYLELSVSSPVQNSSGAITCILCLVILKQSMDALSGIGVAAVCLGVLALGIIERRLLKAPLGADSKKYTIGFTAFMMPLIYSVLDSLGTFFDAYYLDDFAATPLVGVTAENFEDTANVTYELTFLFVAVILYLYVRVIKKERFTLVRQRQRLFASLFETGGQAAYVYAMSGRGIVAAPMIASYSVVSLILSRLFLGEKLTKSQYAAIATVILGIVLMGISEGMAG